MKSGFFEKYKFDRDYLEYVIEDAPKKLKEAISKLPEGRYKRELSWYFDKNGTVQPQHIKLLEGEAWLYLKWTQFLSIGWYDGFYYGTQTSKFLGLNTFLAPYVEPYVDQKKLIPILEQILSLANIMESARKQLRIEEPKQGLKMA